VSDAVTSRSEISIEPVTDKRGREAFVDCGRTFSDRLENFVPQLRGEQLELVDPDKNPFFGHAKVQLFIARRAGKAVGRISAHIDELALTMPADQGFGPGTGFFGYFDAEDDATARALLTTAEGWLAQQGMTRVLGPISLSIWEEPGLLIQGHDHPPTVMMGHNSAAYQPMVEGAGYQPVKQLKTYELDITKNFPPLIERIVASGEKSARITIRKVDKSKFDQEAAIILGILNDAWGKNWGFVPITDAEVAFTGKKLKPLVFEDLIMIAELEGEPVAFMMTLPDLNEALKPLNGSLFPFGWIKLLRWLRKPQVRTMRVPLMGVVQRLQSTRMASQLAFMMIEYIRRNALAHYSATRGEIGWVLDDNQGMNAIADAIESRVNKIYQVYEKTL
jgi:hypothetical protein